MNNADIFKTIESLPKMPTISHIPSVEHYNKFMNTYKISTDYFNCELNKIIEATNTLINIQMKAIEPILPVMQTLVNTQLNELTKISTSFTLAFQQILGNIDYDKLYKIFERINQKQYENESIDDIVAEISQDYTNEELQMMQEDCFIIINEFNEYIHTYIKTAIDVASDEERKSLITIAEKIMILQYTENKPLCIIFFILHFVCFVQGVLRSVNNKMLSDDTPNIVS